MLFTATGSCFQLLGREGDLYTHPGRASTTGSIGADKDTEMYGLFKLVLSKLVLSKLVLSSLGSERGLSVLSKLDKTSLV